MRSPIHHPTAATTCRSIAGRNGFTLVEALVSVTITAMSGSVLLLAVHSSLHTIDESLEQTTANGIARQLIDEVLGTRYTAVGASPYQYPLTPNSWELQGNGRERFNDTDDYHQFVAQPPEDLWGVELGAGDNAGGTRHPALQVRSDYFDGWRQSVQVYYVNENAPDQRLPAGATSAMRCVDVTISRWTPVEGSRQLVRLKRVFAYVPPPE